MAATKASILQKVKALCRTDAPAFLGGALDVYVAGGLATYSRDKPFHDVEDVTGGSANLMSTPTTWADRWSLVTRIVYPYVDEDSSLLQDDAFEIDSIPVGGSPVEKIRFLGSSPATTETVRIWFTRPHVCTSATCTVYAQDEPAFAHLVASLIETAKASYYLALKDQGLEADLVDYGGKAAEARALAEMHEKTYKAGIGVPEGGSIPASVSGEMDVAGQSGIPWAQPHHLGSRR